MRILKKYPNRRLYDTRDSVYVTLEDVRQMVLANESIKVVDSKTDADLTRSVLLQIIAEQEGEGHEPLLTNRVLQQLIRFYGDSMQGVLSRYIEQSVMIFLEQQEMYQRRMRDVLDSSPVKLVQKIADQNISFWRGVMKGDSPLDLIPRPGGQGAGEDFAAPQQQTSAPAPQKPTEPAVTAPSEQAKSGNEGG